MASIAGIPNDNLSQTHIWYEYKYFIRNVYIFIFVIFRWFRLQHLDRNWTERNPGTITHSICKETWNNVFHPGQIPDPERGWEMRGNPLHSNCSICKGSCWKCRRNCPVKLLELESELWLHPRHIIVVGPAALTPSPASSLELSRSIYCGYLLFFCLRRMQVWKEFENSQSYYSL